ncbi:MAG TPA: periplasmic heavy metal sensor [Candidatus Obscuribacter sp.]|nr:periplasmic heavy metal sensor [Candidatus Obscuribacter sp.]HNG21473.1 periplasmic heavy metal sensor [Candidatus Obscuribacter sp.]HNM49256.1 periplasmic heavy metal sensor [Candidatus Obscuribacter sp.]HNN63032.1 periplasmic heavy metal sensor [Candidatus Obscuribacter sp.]
MSISRKSLFSFAGAVALVLPLAINQPVLAQEGAAFDQELPPLALDLPPGVMPLPGAIAIDGPPPGDEMVIGFGSLPMPVPAMEAGRMCPSSGGCPLMKGENALTDEQFEKMYSLKNAMLDKVGPKMAELSSLERQLKDVLTGASIDAKRANDLKNKITQAKSDLASIKVEHQIAMAETLTAEQRKALRQAMVKGSMSPMGGKGKMMMRSRHRGMGGPR